MYECVQFYFLLFITFILSHFQSAISSIRNGVSAHCFFWIDSAIDLNTMRDFDVLMSSKQKNFIDMIKRKYSTTWDCITWLRGKRRKIEPHTHTERPLEMLMLSIIISLHCFFLVYLVLWTFIGVRCICSSSALPNERRHFCHYKSYGRTVFYLLLDICAIWYVLWLKTCCGTCCWYHVLCTISTVDVVVAVVGAVTAFQFHCFPVDCCVWDFTSAQRRDNR